MGICGLGGFWYSSLPEEVYNHEQPREAQHHEQPMQVHNQEQLGSGPGADSGSGSSACTNRGIRNLAKFDVP